MLVFMYSCHNTCACTCACACACTCACACMFQESPRETFIIESVREVGLYNTFRKPGRKVDRLRNVSCERRPVRSGGAPSLQLEEHCARARVSDSAWVAGFGSFRYLTCPPGTQRSISPRRQTAPTLLSPVFQIRGATCSSLLATLAGAHTGKAGGRVHRTKPGTGW